MGKVFLLLLFLLSLSHSHCVYAGSLPLIRYVPLPLFLLRSLLRLCLSFLSLSLLLFRLPVSFSLTDWFTLSLYFSLLLSILLGGLQDAPAWCSPCLTSWSSSTVPVLLRNISPVSSCLTLTFFLPFFVPTSSIAGQQLNNSDFRKLLMTPRSGNSEMDRLKAAGGSDESYVRRKTERVSLFSGFERA